MKKKNTKINRKKNKINEKIFREQNKIKKIWLINDNVKMSFQTTLLSRVKININAKIIIINLANYINEMTKQRMKHIRMCHIEF